MRLKHWPILIFSGLMWGVGIIIVFLIPAALLHSTAQDGSLAVLALGVLLGIFAFGRCVRCFIEVINDRIQVTGVVRRKFYALSDVQDVQASLPKGDSSGAVRSPFVVVYPYLVLRSGHRVRMTPGGSFSWSLGSGDVDVTATPANEVATALRGWLSHISSNP